MKTESIRAILTKTQYKYWVEYYKNDLSLADIALKYNVHITTVCHVMKNAQKRIVKAGL